MNKLAVASIALAALLVSGNVGASPCPAVMIVLDTSGSMADDPSGGGSTPAKIDIAKTALTSLVAQDGDQLPFGFTHFDTGTGFGCGDGIEIVVKPMHGTKAAVTSAIAATMPGGGTNTGPAVDQVQVLPEMHDANRPGSYIILVTDGEPNCPGSVGTETTDPAYTVGAITRAAAAGVKTFVIGFGSLPSADSDAMDMMATAGGEPCTGTTCNGKKYYQAEDSAGLQAAINAISSQISGEFGGSCDDSCYANGCPSAGEICVQGACVADPCASVSATCAPGDFCYTDGTSTGQCAVTCPTTCPSGQVCTLTGCQISACASLTCGPGTSCVNGSCQASTCSATCMPGLSCINGQCKDDPCRYITCPTDATCTPDVGTCVAMGSSSTGGDTTKRGGGCDYAGARGGQTAIGFLLAMLALAFVRRARPTSR